MTLPKITMSPLRQLVPMSAEFRGGLSGCLIGSDVPYISAESGPPVSDWFRRIEKATNEFCGAGQAAWAVLEDGEPAGIVLVKASPESSMLVIVIDTSFRGRGLAPAATAAASEWLLAEGVTAAVMADTKASNAAARSALESSGFKEVRMYLARVSGNSVPVVSYELRP